MEIDAASCNMQTGKMPHMAAFFPHIQHAGCGFHMRDAIPYPKSGFLAYFAAPVQRSLPWFSNICSVACGSFTLARNIMDAMMYGLKEASL